MARLSFSLLGSFQVTLDGQPLENFRAGSARALLAYLVMQPGRQFHRGHLAALLWPDSPQEEAQVNLRQTLYRLRIVFGDAANDYVRGSHRTLGFAAESDYWLDVEAFTEHLDRCRNHPHRTLAACPACAERIEAALQFYRGDFLSSFSLSASNTFEEWRTLQRESLHKRAVDALNTLALHYQRRHEYDRAAERLRQILAMEPWREEIHARLMQVLVLGGHRSAALAQYETCRRVLERELAVRPSQETEQLLQAIQAGDLRPAPADEESPYKGLTYFTQADAANFYGREVYAESLYARVQQGGLVALIGASGSGKTSLLNAGLIPRLLTATEKEDRWWVVTLRPGSRPFDSLAQALIPHLSSRRLERLAGPSGPLAERLAAGNLSLAAVVAEILRGAGKDRILLIIDQFEELYTLCSNEECRHRFADLLVCHRGDPRLTVLIALRADFTHHAISQRALADVIQTWSVVVGPMTQDEMRRAIEEPARNQGVLLESGLTERLLQDVGDRAGALPLLQFALTVLWQERTAIHLTHDAYDHIGQLGGALINYAEDIYACLSSHQQQAVRNIFLRLVRLGVNTPDTRRTALRAEFDDDQWAVVRKLADSRLLVTDRDEQGQETVELAHEVLIQSWPRLAEWLREDHTFHLWRERLRASMHIWESHEKDDSALLRGGVLAEAETHAADRMDDLSASEQEFLHAGRTLRLHREAAEEARRERERRRSLALAATLEEQAAVQRRARRASALAQSHSLVNAVQLALAQSDSGKALRLARQAVAVDDPPVEAELALADAAYAPGTRRILSGHTGPVHAVAFHPDQQRAVSAGADRVVILWDLSSGAQVRRYTGHADIVYSVALSACGKTLLSASADGALRLWEVETGREIACLSGHAGEVRQACFLPGDRAALSAGSDGALVLWNLDEGVPQARWPGHPAAIHILAVSPDGQSALSGDARGGLVHWSLPEGRILRRFPGLREQREQGAAGASHHEAVKGIAFIGDGTRAISVSADRFAVLWDLSSGQAVEKYTSVEIGLDSVAPASSERTVLLGSWGGEVVLLDLESGESRRLPGHSGRVLSLAYSPNGRRALSGSADGNVHLWDLCSGAELRCWELPPTHKAVASLDITPDERLAAVGMFNGDIGLWDLASGKEIRRLRGHRETIYAGVDFLPGGRRLLSASGGAFAPEKDFSLRLWDVEKGAEVRRFEGHTDMLWDMALSRDGSFAVSASHDGTLRRWEIETGEGRLLYSVAPQSALCVAIRPDGSRLLLGLGQGGSNDPDYSLRLLDSCTGQEVGRFVGHAEALGDVVFSPDGRLALSGGQDGRVLFWNVASGEKVGELTGATGGVMRLAFSPDGALAALGSTTGELLLWDVASRTLIRRFVGHQRNVTQVLFSADGRRIFSAGHHRTGAAWRGSVREWRVDRTLEELLAWIRTNRPA